MGHRTKPDSEPLQITATKAKNKLGQVLDQLTKDGVVLITRHNSPKAALLSMEKYKELTSGVERKLDALSEEFDEMLAAMQTAKSRAGMKEAFDATPGELGEAAVKAASRRG